MGVLVAPGVNPSALPPGATSTGGTNVAGRPNTSPIDSSGNFTTPSGVKVNAETGKQVITSADYGKTVQGPYVGVPTTVNGVPYTPPSAGSTTRANFSTPSAANATVASPAVITSSTAADHYGNIGNQLDQLHTDTANHTAALAAAAQPQTNTNTQEGGSNTKANNSSNTQPDAAAAQPAPATSTFSTGDPQIDSLLNALGPAEKSVADNTTAGGETSSQLQSDMAANQADEASTLSYYGSQLQSISSGTYPLSDSEQQLLNSTINSYNQLVRGQLGANASFVGKMTETMASLGIEQTAPFEAQGMAYAAINEGTYKIADLNSKMASAIGKLTQAFQAQDFKNTQSLWTDAQKAFQDRTSALEKMQTSLNDSIKQQQTQMETYTKTAINAIISSGRLSLTQQQDLVNNAYKQGVLSERTAKDANNYALSYAKEQFNEYYKMNPDAKYASLSADLQGAIDYVQNGGDADTAKQKLIGSYPAEANQINNFFKNVGTINSSGGGGAPPGVTPSGSTGSGSGFSLSSFLNGM